MGWSPLRSAFAIGSSRLLNLGGNVQIIETPALLFN